jgi:hypothetical protein
LRIFGNPGQQLRVLSEVAVLQEGVQSLSALRVVECPGQQLPVQQPQKRIGEGTVKLAVQGRRLLQGLQCGNVRPRLAVAGAGEQHHMLIGIGRRLRTRAYDGIDVSHSQITHIHR